MTAQQPEDEQSGKTGISQYEFYVLGIERLLVKAPWELERAVSAYHESFLTEQRCVGLAILLLLGEEHVSPSVMAEKSMPGFEEQTRASVNQAVFVRALKHYFEAHHMPAGRAEKVLEHMQSYITDSREAHDQHKSPLDAMLETVIKRVPPQTDEQREQYAARIQKIYDYIEGLVNGSIFKRYEIIP